MQHSNRCTVQQNGPILVTPATADPVTVAEAKLYCQTEADDVLIAGLIAAATEYVQTRTGRQFQSATYKQTWDIFDHWRGVLYLDLSPVSAVSWLKYYDVDGTLTTIDAANYWTDLNSRPSRIMPTLAYCWPTTQIGRPEAVQVQYVVGSVSMSPALQVAVKTLVKHWFDNRSPVITSGAIAKDIPHSLEYLLTLYDRNGYQ